MNAQIRNYPNPRVCALVARSASTLHAMTEAVPPRGNVLSFIKHAAMARDAALTLVAVGLTAKEIVELVDHEAFTRVELYGLLVNSMAREVRHTLNTANKQE